jgi:hypothetical protein
MKSQEQLMADIDRPDFPTIDRVEKASREDLAKWFRFLPVGDTPEQKKVMKRIEERFKEKGGMTPAISSKIGYGGV